MHISRLLDIELPGDRSAFLWGARKVGKTTFLKKRFSRSLVFDFLRTDLFLEFSKRPALLRERLLAVDQERLKYPIILDEVQKVPGILDEVHWLMENRGLRFLLSGSSARKLRHGRGANLLGGRAWRFEMLPLVFPEVKDLNLLRALNNGLIPVHYLEDDARRSLRAYAGEYLKEEVFSEGLIRNIPAFSRFFDALGYSHGELTNYSNIARECGVDSKTVREYFGILVDTLVGRFVEPYSGHSNRQVITRTPKFYLFDVGVAGALTRRVITEERGPNFTKAFRHLVFMELSAHSRYLELDYDIRFWRTKAGAEVDFVLGDGEIAVEVKGSDRIERRDLRGLQAFSEEHSPRLSIVVCAESEERIHDGVHIKPWRRFLRDLWSGEIIS